MQHPRCKDCHFWLKPKKGNRKGECHYIPSHPLMPWIPTGEDEFCSYFLSERCFIVLGPDLEVMLRSALEAGEANLAFVMSVLNTTVDGAVAYISELLEIDESEVVIRFA